MFQPLTHYRACVAHQCPKPACFHFGGNWYCKAHDPHPWVEVGLKWRDIPQEVRDRILTAGVQVKFKSSPVWSRERCVLVGDIETSNSGPDPQDPFFSTEDRIFAYRVLLTPDQLEDSCREVCGDPGRDGERSCVREACCAAG